MREYGKVHTSYWTSSNIRSMSEDGRTLAMYLLTCPHGTIAGVFRLPDGYACEDLQWNSERVCKGFAELFSNGFANRCETTKWVWIRKHFEWNPPENPNQRKAVEKVILQVPGECSWRLDFMRDCGDLIGLNKKPFANPSETVSESVTGAVTVTVVNPIHPSDEGCVLADGEVPVDNFSDEEKSEKVSRPKRLACPHQKITDLYHEILTCCPQVMVLTEARKGFIQSRWRDAGKEYKWVCEQDGLDWFKRYFEFVSKSDFLTGRSQPSNGRSPFVADLEWLVRPNNFAKIVEGKYHGSES